MAIANKNFNVDDAEDFDDGTRARTYASDDGASSGAEDGDARAPAPSLRVRNWEADDDAAYAGKVVQRKDVVHAGDESPDEDAMAAWSDAEPFGASDSEDAADDDADDDDDMEQDESESDGVDEDDGDENAEKLMRDFAKEDSAQLMSAKDSAKLVEKALHVRHQKILWERFLEVQIYTKRLLSSTKAVTDTSDATAAAVGESGEAKAQAVERLYACIDAVSSLQDKMCNIPELTGAATTASETGKKRKRSVEDVWTRVLASSQAALPQYNEVLNAYSRKTSLAGGNQAKKFKAVNQDILAQVEAVLADVQRVKRKAHAPLDADSGGHTSAEEDLLDELMYDDSDFYQQLLKEFIESGGGAGSGADALQQRTHRKKRKVVNRKASKGRQLRYTVHPKLENFMFPEPYPRPEMDVDELFRSLFGQVRQE